MCRNAISKISPRFLLWGRRSWEKNTCMNSNSKGLHTFASIKEVLKLEYTELKLILFSNIINLSVILDLSQSSGNQAEQPKSICSIL